MRMYTCKLDSWCQIIFLFGVEFESDTEALCKHIIISIINYTFMCNIKFLPVHELLSVHTWTFWLDVQSSGHVNCHGSLYCSVLSIFPLFSDLESLDWKFVYCGKYTCAVKILQFAWTLDELFSSVDFVCKQGVQFKIYYVYIL